MLPLIEGTDQKQSYFEAYPDPTTVFAEPVEKYAKHIHPLISFDLSFINPAWQGRIHLVSPIDPDEEMIGLYTPQYHNEFLGTNWIGFRLDSESKYHLLGDFRFFLLESSPTKEPWKGALGSLAEWYVRQRASYKEYRERFRMYGGLYHKNFLPGTINECRNNFFSQIGGGAPRGNWQWNGAPVRLDETEPGNFVPRMPDGTRFHFIACVPSWHYQIHGADNILLFFEPESRTALLTFDYS